jgi:hypothetical protein
VAGCFQRPCGMTSNVSSAADDQNDHYRFLSDESNREPAWSTSLYTGKLLNSRCNHRC